jgi:hypothetical protein
MNKTHLVACVGCARHVRASEAACPFCRADLPRALRDAAPRRPPAVRLGRAALMALGTGAATIATACGGNVGDGDPHGMTAQPAYGAAIIDDAGNDGSPDANFMGTAAYGGVSPEDGGGRVLDSAAPLDAVAPPDDAEDESDVTTPPPHDGGVMPAYGLPPSP